MQLLFSLSISCVVHFLLFPMGTFVTVFQIYNTRFHTDNAVYLVFTQTSRTKTGSVYQDQWGFAFHSFTTALWNSNLQLHVDSDFPVIDSLNDVIYRYAERPQHTLTESCQYFPNQPAFPQIRSQAYPSYVLFVDMLCKKKQNILLLAGNSYTALGP